jgi:hypothetical protein
MRKRLAAAQRLSYQLLAGHPTAGGAVPRAVGTRHRAPRQRDAMIFGNGPRLWKVLHYRRERNVTDQNAFRDNHEKDKRLLM